MAAVTCSKFDWVLVTSFYLAASTSDKKVGYTVM